MNRMSRLFVIVAAALVVGMPAQAQDYRQYISQYYEGAGSDKWIELKNGHAGTLDFRHDWHLGLWSDANSEAYKTGGAPSETWDLSELGFLPSGGVVLLSHSSAVNPPYAAADGTNDLVINFDGNDSVVLYQGSPFSAAIIVDVVGFTDAGNEGADTSWVRTSTAAGWDANAGSNVTDFPTVWVRYTTAQVDAASPGDEEYLGQSSVPVELQSITID